MAEIQSFYDAVQHVARSTKTTRVIRFFQDIHLGNGHRGLAKIARDAKIDVLNLAPGEFVVFANKSRTGLKIFSPGNIIAYMKSPNTQSLDMRVVALIPRFFAGREFKYDSALHEILTKNRGKAA